MVRPAVREEFFPIAMGALVLAFLALLVCYGKHFTLLYGDAVAHLGIARRIFDSRDPGLAQLGGVWLPLPHLMMLPFVQKMEWWQDGMAGAWPSMICYLVGVIGFYRLARLLMVERWALAATAFYALNPNLLYLSTTAMSEPLFLALLIWGVLATVECVAAMRAWTESSERGRGALERTARRRLVLAGVLAAAAVYTRYDGWVLAAAMWCVLAWEWRQHRALKVGRAFTVFTVLVVAAPLGWLWYNQRFFHDPLDFLRGPYSASAIERRTTPPGSKHYLGWHDPIYAAKLFLRTAQLDVSAWETGFAVTLAALAGLWLAMRKKSSAAWLLWLPLPFYVYSIAYGSVPIFIPKLWPFSYYNSRYGMEMLPALAMFACIAAAFGEQWLRGRQPLAARLMQPLSIMVIALNAVAMMHSVPLVLQEGKANAETRVPFERALALDLRGMQPGSTLLMSSSDHIGAIQEAGIPLKQTVNEGDYYDWRAAMENPARAAAFAVAIAGDPVDAAVKAHPEGLTELDIVCSTGQPCARIYRSDTYKATR